METKKYQIFKVPSFLILKMYFNFYYVIISRLNISPINSWIFNLFEKKNSLRFQSKVTPIVTIVIEIIF